MSELNRCSVEFGADGVNYRLHFSLAVLARVQLDLGISSFDELPSRLITPDGRPAADMQALLSLVQNGLKKQDGGAWVRVQAEEAGDLPVPLKELTSLCAEALSRAFLGDEILRKGEGGTDEPPLQEAPAL